MLKELRIEKAALAGAFIVLLAFSACNSNHDSEFTTLNSELEYQSPIDFDILLAGNFGEPRPWHFHGGLDIKTDNQEGKNVMAVADGYVSRLTVGMFGFGNAIYVSHPDGLTSVYCHLQRFADKYERLISRSGGQDTLSVWFPADSLPVRGGELIAISGNTGHSTGPHLHLELHDTRTWAMRDPMEKLARLIADTVAPQAHSLMAIPQGSEGSFCGSSQKQTFPIGQGGEKRQNTDFEMQREFTAWGRVGFALWADDYSHNTYHRYGIRSMRLLVDGREVFRSDVDSIPISCQQEVNLWGDYDHWLKTRIWYMKAFREKDMRLPILHAGFDRGIIDFREERPYRLTFILRDYQGNSSTYRLTVRGERNSCVAASAGPGVLSRYQLFRQCLWPLYSFRE